MNNRGRPRKDIIKDNFVKIRLDDKEMEMLKYICEKTGETRSELVRNRIKDFYEAYKRMEGILNERSENR